MHRSTSRSRLHFFFFTPPAPPDIHTLSLHDALPISSPISSPRLVLSLPDAGELNHPRSSEPYRVFRQVGEPAGPRSEEHTSELQSHSDLVCRLLLEKKKNNRIIERSKHRAREDTKVT